MTDTPASMTYASVVSHESVCCALTLAALNDLQVKAGDIQNAYLTAPCEEKITCICGPEFGEDAGKTARLVRAALYHGLKSSGAAYRDHLAKGIVRHLGYTPCLADNDVWLKEEVREDGFQYYSYILIYVDDILVIHHDAMKVLKKIDWYFKMKPESMGDCDIYLGCKLRLHTLGVGGVQAWLQLPSKYVNKEAVANAESYYLKHYNLKFPTKVSSPFPTGYRPEMDMTPTLKEEDASYYQSQIGVLRWIVEIGRGDIIVEVLLLASRQLALPREGGHDMAQIFHCYAYLKIRRNGCLVFDPKYPDEWLSKYEFCDGQAWSKRYGKVNDEVGKVPPFVRTVWRSVSAISLKQWGNNDIWLNSVSAV
jgi:Reverse transcriptase (RNA-dependent DNA polymerase)